MTDISPITDEAELRREAAAVPTPSFAPHPQPPVSPAAPVGVTPVAAAADSTSLPEPRNKRIFEGHTLSSPSELVADSPTRFSYRLPVFSYVLMWIYVMASVVLTIFLVAYLNYANSVGNYTKSMSAGKGGSFFDLMMTFGVPSTESLYNTIIWPLAIALAVCLAMIVVLISGRKIFRYVGMLIWVLVFGYLIYKIVKFMSDSGMKLSWESSSSGSANSSPYADLFMAQLMVTWATVFAPYVPYTVIPITTFVYLLTPKAVQAYE
jgi:hypothetical protein